MKRTFNFTGRSRIARSDVDIRLSEDTKAFTVELGDVNSELPDGTLAVVEAYERTTYERHALGRIPDALKRGPFLLERVQGDAALFRVKFISENGALKGTLLAVADQISPTVKSGDGEDESDHKRVSLLHARPAQLDGTPWRVVLDSQRFPMLEYEERLASQGFAQFISSDAHFRSLMMPEVVRQVLTHVLLIDRPSEFEDGTWQAEWTKLAASWVHAPAPGEDEETEATQLWINDVVAAFSRQTKALEGVESVLGRPPA